MAFDDLITRSGAQALIPEDVAAEIIQGVIEMSSIMRLARKLQNMGRNERRLPVLSSLITAGFVTGDTGVKSTSSQLWNNKFIEAEELAVIVPIPENVLDDSSFDIFGEIKPRIQEAFGLAFDAALLYGTNAPASWPDDLLTGASSAGNAVTLGTGADLYEDVLGEDGVVSLVEQDGFMVTGHIATLNMRGKLRSMRDANGMPFFMSNPQDPTRYFLDGAPVEFPRNGAMDASQALLFAGDWSQLVYAIRRDITFKILDQAVITDGANEIVFNLAQQDMVALRAVMRLGWQVPNPINRIQTTEANRYPFGVLTAS